MGIDWRLSGRCGRVGGLKGGAKVKTGGVKVKTPFLSSTRRRSGARRPWPPGAGGVNKGFLFAALAVVLLPARLFADIYVYTDDDGVIHFTNVPTSGRFEWVAPERGGPAPALSSFNEIIVRAAGRYGVDPALVKAVIKAESDFDPEAVSPAGAVGLMQLMPETARVVGVRDLRDPAQNIYGGVRHLSRLLRVFDGDTVLALAAYNAGENAVRRYGGLPPFRETREYVRRVLRWRDHYRRGL